MMMASVNFYFHEDLELFLHNKSETGWISIKFIGHETVKHLIESLGVPHTEVDVILINGNSVGFDWRPANGDKINVFPEKNDLANQTILRLQPEIIKEPQFVLDGHLGKLASYLRLLGFDTKYRNDIADYELVEISIGEDRIILTRDRGVLKRSIVKHGYFIRSTAPRNQVVELLNKYQLRKFAKPFTRCVKCNGRLISVSKDEVLDRLEPRTKLYYEDFRVCSECNQIYWKGSHFIKMERFVASLLNNHE